MPDDNILTIPFAPRLTVEQVEEGGDRAPRVNKIPLVLVAGFLGSGKTTFLQALMRELMEKGVGFSVVVNDFENA